LSEPRHLPLAPAGAVPDDGDPDLAYELDLPDDLAGCDAGTTLYNAVGLRLEPGRVSDYDAGDTILRRGERVVCEVAQGTTVAEVAVPSRRQLVKGHLPKVLRRAGERDVATEAQLRAREQAVWKAARDVARSMDLPVKIVRAEAVSGGQRFVVFFASEEKGLHKGLLHGLVRETGERVELRQIGMRDAAKVVGGVGPCGLQLCCNTFLSDFAPISIKMAKDQGLALNPQKVSGVCGRLLCCLVYEEAFYRAQRQLLPRVGEDVTTPRGAGRVRDLDVLQMLVKVVLQGGDVLTLAVGEVVRGPGEAISSSRLEKGATDPSSDRG
jgi:cell fate regulator YaaT (PSP1 superfamily)